MYEFWVFQCPSDVERSAAESGDTVCPMITVFSCTEEEVRNQFPNAMHVHKVKKGLDDYQNLSKAIV